MTRFIKTCGLWGPRRPSHVQDPNWGIASNVRPPCHKGGPRFYQAGQAGTVVRRAAQVANTHTAIVVIREGPTWHASCLAKQDLCQPTRRHSS